jgi:hypothetical protein
VFRIIFALKRSKVRGNSGYHIRQNLVIYKDHLQSCQYLMIPCIRPQHNPPSKTALPDSLGHALCQLCVLPVTSLQLKWCSRLYCGVYSGSLQLHILLSDPPIMIYQEYYFIPPALWLATSHISKLRDQLSGGLTYCYGSGIWETTVACMSSLHKKKEYIQKFWE